MSHDISRVLKLLIADAGKKAGIEDPTVNLEHPDDISHGDFSTNIAMVHAKALKQNPRALAEKILEEMKKAIASDAETMISSVEVAGPGFINIKLKNEFFTSAILSEIHADFGKIKTDAHKKVMVEYTDPNPFKIFHIGHLMANTVGESLSRIVEFSGADVVRANYYGDVGLHVAKTMWGILAHKADFPTEKDSLVSRVDYLGKMYVLGSEQYETNEQAKKEITDINKKVFEKSDAEINHFYDLGKKWSLEYFETIYAKLGTHFDYYFPESEVAGDGVKAVNEFLAKGVFEKSDGAIVFPGEKHGVHTRVFINSQGLPTYEAKEVGLTKKKFAVEPKLAESIVVTANEQSDYFKVLLKAISLMYPEIAKKTTHKSHGLMRFSSGKMSSRKGNIISAEDLLGDIEALVDEKIKDRNFTPAEHDEVRRDVAVSALKYVVLRQAIGGDIIYDPEKAVSFEGDSGPYLQYACVRARNVVRKAHEAGIARSGGFVGFLARIIRRKQSVPAVPSEITLLEKLLVRFPEVVAYARAEYAPHHITTYLTELSAAFNAYYANNQIVDKTNLLSPYRVALTQAFVYVMTNGLWLLGIRVPEKM